MGRRCGDWPARSPSRSLERLAQRIEHLRGERPLAETIELVKIRTHQFAKRQMTWFKGQLSLEWIDRGPAGTTADIVERILSHASSAKE